MSTTPGARVPSSVGNPLRTSAVVSALLAATDGATIDPSGHPYRGDGILVAVKGPGIVVTPRAVEEVQAAGLTVPDLIHAWVTTRAPEVVGNYTPARYYGVWHQEADADIPEAWYFDVVEAFSSAEEDRAIEAGRARGEVAIWHNGRKAEILL
jgi:hypothetical protein